MGIMERKVRERDLRRSEILDSARRVFIECGLEHASMDRIATDAELAKGTLYLYYKNREELLMALIGKEFESLLVQIENVLVKKKTPDKKLLDAVRTFYKFSHENELFYSIITHLNVKQLFGCDPDDESDVALRFREIHVRMMSVVQRLIQEGVDSGIYRLDQPVEYIVVQIMIIMKGIMVITQNNILPPEWRKLSVEQLLVNTTSMLIRGMSKSNQTTKGIR